MSRCFGLPSGTYDECSKVSPARADASRWPRACRPPRRAPTTDRRSGTMRTDPRSAPRMRDRRALGCSRRGTWREFAAPSTRRASGFCRYTSSSTSRMRSKLRRSRGKRSVVAYDFDERIPGYYVPASRQHDRRHGQGVEHPFDRGADGLGARRRRRRRPVLHEREQILALVGRHAQRRRDALENVGRNLNVAPLLEPGVPGDADARQARRRPRGARPGVRRRFVSGRPTCVGVRRARQPFRKSMSWRRCVVGALILFKFAILGARDFWVGVAVASRML